MAQLQQALAATKAAHGAAKGRLDAKRARLKECDAEIKALEKAKAGLVKEAAAKEAEKRRLDNKWVGGSHFLTPLTPASLLSCCCGCKKVHARTSG